MKRALFNYISGCNILIFVGSFITDIYKFIPVFIIGDVGLSSRCCLKQLMLKFMKGHQMKIIENMHLLCETKNNPIRNVILLKKQIIFLLEWRKYCRQHKNNMHNKYVIISLFFQTICNMFGWSWICRLKEATLMCENNMDKFIHNQRNSMQLCAARKVICFVWIVKRGPTVPTPMTWRQIICKIFCKITKKKFLY